MADEPGAAPPQPSGTETDDNKDKELEEMKRLLAEKDAKIKAMEQQLENAQGDTLESPPNDNNKNIASTLTDEGDSKQPPKTDVTLAIGGIPEYDSYPFSVAAKFYFMASVKAPYFRAEKRAFIDLVAVVDESGSMGGERIKLVRETVNFIIKNLEQGDRFGIVGYSNGSRVVLPLTRMGEEGRKRAIELANGLCASGGTALCAGLVTGVNMMRDRTGSKNDVSSVMLFTDGQANEGPTSAAGIMASVRSGNIGHNAKSAPGRQLHNRAARNMILNRPPVQQAPQRRQIAPVFMQQQLPQLQQQQGVAPPPQLPPQQQQQQQVQVQGQTQPPPVPPGPPPVPVPQPMSSTAGGNDSDEKEQAKDKDKEIEGHVDLPCTINTFGFGSGHNESLLENIAENGRGMYAFIENAAMVADTFAECLGGLVSTIGQDLKIKVEALNAVEVNRCVSAGYKLQVLKPRKVHQISITDIQSEENRELIFELKLPALSAAKPEDPIVRVSVEYMNVVKDTREMVSAVCSVNRIDGTQIGERNIELDVQYNRVMAANAMEQADQLANQGKLEEARKVLSAAQTEIGRSRSKDDSFSKNLVNDMQNIANNMRSRQQFTTHGGKMLKMNKMSHMMQRSNQSSAYASQSTYQNRSKSAMKSKFSGH